jgi:hypothetical protein
MARISSQEVRDSSKIRAGDVLEDCKGAFWIVAEAPAGMCTLVSLHNGRVIEEVRKDIYSKYELPSNNIILTNF